MARKSVVIDLEVRNKKARQALQGAGDDLDRLSTRTQAFEKRLSQGLGSLNRKTLSNVDNVARKFGDVSRNARGSIQPVQNLTRIIEDAPFGVRGVANNINPFIESFGRMKQQAGSTSAAMKQLLTSAFTGPGALLTISALVTSAITAIQMGLLDLGDEAENTEAELQGILDAIDDLEGVVDRDFGLLGNVEERIQQNQRAIELAEQRDQLEKERRQAAQQNDFDRIERLDNQINSTEKAITLLGFENNETEKLQSNLDELQQKQKLYSGEVGNSEQQLSAFVDRVQSDADQAIQRFEAGVTGGEEAVRNQMEALETTIDTYRSAANAGRDDLIPVINTLNETYEDLEETLTESDGLSEQEKSAKEAARALEQARREMLLEAQPEDEILGGGVGDIDVGLDTDTGARDTKIGSIADQEAELSDLQEQFNNVASDEKRGEIVQNILDVRGKIQDMKSDLEDAGDSGQESMDAATAAADMLGNALAQAVIRGEDLGGVLKSLAAQLGSRAIVTGLGAILTGGASLGSQSFLSAMFGGFAHGTDMGFPGVGRVGERGEELVVAPPMSSVITNENIERMDSWRKEARQGAQNISAMGGNQMEGAVMNALSKLNLNVETRTEGRDLVTMIRKELNQQGGKGGNGSI